MLLLTSFLLLSCLAFAQKTTTLKVIINFSKADTSNSVTLQLYLLPDTILVNSKVINNGNADFNVKPFSKFLLRVTSVSFENINPYLNLTHVGNP